LANDLVVVGDEDSHRAHVARSAIGSETRTVAPRFPETTSSEPPSCRTRLACRDADAEVLHVARLPEHLGGMPRP